MTTAIQISNLSKQYKLGTIGTGTLSHDLNRWYYKIRGKEDPYLKIGEINNPATSGNSSLVWALKNINCEIQKTDTLGIIGKNGAGKSTLLKILSRVTGPTTGSIKAKGRIASLLEVGTGFHKELTGRENIFLNGAILGMTKFEIRKKLDAIVDFSGVERYLDTPVKRYSSGMLVRLGFAVAAFLEPEILVVDEVLAVGDIEFQKKAIGKMKDVSKDANRTVLFVSHNMDSISSLCNRCIVLNQGSIAYDGSSDEAINYYIGISAGHHGDIRIEDGRDMERSGQRKLGQLVGMKICKPDGQLTQTFAIGDPVEFKIEAQVFNKQENPQVGIVISNLRGTRITHLISDWYGGTGPQEGLFNASFKLTDLCLYPGNYNISIWIRVFANDAADDFIENITSLNIINSPDYSDISFQKYSAAGGVLSKVELNTQ